MFEEVSVFSPCVLNVSVSVSHSACRNAWLCNVVYCRKLKTVFPSGHHRVSFHRNIKPAVCIPVCKSIFFTGCQERMCCRGSLLVIKTWRLLSQECLKCFLQSRIVSQSGAGASPALAPTDWAGTRVWVNLASVYSNSSFEKSAIQLRVTAFA